MHIHYGFTLFSLEVGKEGFGLTSQDALREAVFKKKADDYEEIQMQIEQTRQEIIEHKQNAENNLQKDMYDDGEDAENKEDLLQRQVEYLENKLFDELRIESRFFVSSGLIDIDKEIFNIIHENGLVYNGRLIVKSNF